MATSSPASAAVLLAANLATALAFGAALAHALELPNKIGLARDDYFIVQQIYAGWDRLALVLLVEIVTIVAVMVLYRREPAVWLPATVALLSVVAAQVVFWTFTFPANEATSNWTLKPADWDALRTDWEYSHLTGALFQFIAMIAITVAILSRPGVRTG